MVPADTVLVLNAGSSSLRYAVLDPGDGRRLAGGHVEQLELDGFGPALERVTDELAGAGLAGRLTAVGHRVVHGGARHTSPTLVDDDVLADVEALSVLAPLHNPPAVAGIRRARTVWPDLPHVAVFDTGWFAGLPAAAATVTIDRRVAAEEGIRRFGMHGTSHAWVAGRAADLLGRPLAELGLVTLHLGNGASAAAVRGGRPVETSMGFTPLEGLVMGSRGGDIDPGVLLHLLRHRGYDADRLEDLLHHRSGLAGLAGTGDFRDLLRAVDDGEADARLAYDVYCHRIRKYVGAYLAVLDGADAVVFTGGVGENVPRLRADALRGLDRLGIEVDDDRNDSAGSGPAVISPAGTRVSVLVVPTDEELSIARQVAELLAGS
ncbi:acetate/propionate family kinase [Nocardioides humi]|uniref:Acetate kinase n=1 Tax=Nocardioides humi TaxID=449461 RepID=A0ABN2BBF4_9ACTN|nr:acetate kinase [Nocardioides humi]